MSRDMKLDFLRKLTRARVALGRAGDALPTQVTLELQLCHAKARDSVHAEFNVDGVAAAFEKRETLYVRSAAADRLTYLRRPDLGRRLNAEDSAFLQPGPFDIVFILADGLSPVAVETYGAPLVKATLAHLPQFHIAPVVIARQARVALGDEIGERLQARLCVVLIGERPGLTVTDSLGIYMTYEPARGRRDSERNCISNIHQHGLRPEDAARSLVWLINEAMLRRLSGIQLKAAEASIPLESDHKALPESSTNSAPNP